MTGAIKAVADFLYTGIDTVVLTSAYDPPFESNLYIATLAEVGLQVDTIAVVPVIANEKLTVPFQIDSGVSNCGFSDVTAEVNSYTYTLTDASFIYASGGDRVECVDADGVVLGDTRVMSRTSNTIILQDSFTGVDVIRLKIGYIALCIGSDVVKWAKYIIFKKSGDNYPVQWQVNVL